MNVVCECLLTEEGINYKSSFSVTPQENDKIYVSEEVTTGFRHVRGQMERIKAKES